MNYIGRKDSGTYIPPKQGEITLNHAHLLHPIAYSKEVAEYAAEMKIKYREAYLQAINHNNDKT